MRLRAAAVAVLAGLTAAGCGGGTETLTVTGPTVTVTETVTETVAADEGVEQLAASLCREYGPLARTFGGFSDDEEIADALAEEVEDPELRDAVRGGCLAGLE